jgi:hypothetical protein
MDWFKIICYGIGCIIVVYILYLLLPYIMLGLALIGAWHLLEEYYKKKKGR